MLHINTVHVQRETLWVKQLAGEQCKMICSAWACKLTYIAESFVGLCTHSSVWNVSSAHRGECVTTGGMYRPTHLCVAHFELHKKVSYRFFFGVVRLGGVWRRRLVRVASVGEAAFSRSGFSSKQRPCSFSAAAGDSSCLYALPISKRLWRS